MFRKGVFEKRWPYSTGVRGINIKSQNEPIILIAATVICLVASGLSPYDRMTWWMEIAPILIVMPILLATYRSFSLTPLLYRLLFVHALILMVGGHYTYARVPLGFWMQDLFHFSRNQYDRIGHFAQGFIPAILVRELLLRRSPLVRGKLLFFLVVSVCLAFSAFYELTEWWSAEAMGSVADAFLGTQGDPWDTQWDMFYAMIGATMSLFLLGRLHDLQLGRLSAKSK